MENAKPRMYYRHQEEQCPFVLKLHDSPYDVGFAAKDDGTYTPIFDPWNNNVGKALAVKACPMPNTEEERTLRHIGMFSREYARCAAVNAAEAQSLTLEEETETANGEYNLVFAQY